jgi:sugar lactone lactonase YvrE
VDGEPATTQAIDFPASVVGDGAAGFYVSSPVQNRVYRVAADGTIRLFAGAGTYGFSGNGGPAVAAELARPTGLALDSGGNLYIADSANNRIRKVTTDGLISTVAGSGSPGFGGDDGPATSARLNNPTGVAADSGGNFYIADLSNQRVRKVSTDGVITTVAGNGVAGFSGDDGPAAAAQLSNPIAVAVDSSGNLYIADLSNQRIRKVSGSGVITTVAGNGEGGFAGDGGPATSAVLANPAGVAVDSSGNLYLVDFDTGRARKITSDGIINTLAGNGFGGFSGDGRQATTAELAHPTAIAVDTDGSVYIADSGNHRVRKVTSDGLIRTVAGAAISASFAGDESANSAQFHNPAALAAFSEGDLYVADSLNHRIRRVVADGGIGTIAGPGFPGFLGDGGFARTAQLATPQGVALDANGNIYVADTGNNRVRKIAADGLIRTVAGNGARGFAGDGAAATSARLNAPSGVVVDFAGNIFIADAGNNRIRQVTPDGLIRTIAGTGTAGFGGDGAPAVSAQLSGPRSLAIDSGGNLYIADTGNHRIRVISSGGVIRTIAGNGIPSFGGDGGPAISAQLSGPSGVAVDAQANLYIADSGNHRIRMVTRDGTIATLAGIGIPGFSGDGGPPQLAQLANPKGVSVDPAGNVYVADSDNHRVRKVILNLP